MQNTSQTSHACHQLPTKTVPIQQLIDKNSMTLLLLDLDLSLGMNSCEILVLQALPH